MIWVLLLLEPPVRAPFALPGWPRLQRHFQREAADFPGVGALLVLHHQRPGALRAFAVQRGEGRRVRGVGGFFDVVRAAPFAVVEGQGGDTGGRGGGQRDDEVADGGVLEVHGDFDCFHRGGVGHGQREFRGSEILDRHVLRGGADGDEVGLRRGGEFDGFARVDAAVAVELVVPIGTRLITELHAILLAEVRGGGPTKTLG